MTGRVCPRSGVDRKDGALEHVTRSVAVIAAASLAWSAGCGDDKSSSGDEAKPAKSGPSAPAEAKQPPSARKGKDTLRSLLDEAPRAELDAGGLLIDMGGPDQYKYTRGDWKTGWGNSELSPDGVNFAAVPGRKASVELWADGAIAEVVARMRSDVPGQRVSLMIDGKDIGSGDIGADWTLVRAKVPASMATANKQLTVSVLMGKPSQGARAQLDWLWLSDTAGAEPVAPIARVMPIQIGKRTRRALPAPTARSYHYYVEVPADSSLVFDYGSDAAVSFKVSLQADGAEPVQLFSETAKAGDWTEGVVDLSAHAGKVVRLSLTTEGEPTRAGWGEPDIMLNKPPAALPPTGDKPRNVIVVLIDTARADAFKPFNPDTKVHAPAYNAFADDAVVFQRAYNNENWTKPSVTTTLTGLYPVSHDTKRDPSVLPDEVELISERLKKEGFATAAFIANGFISDKFGFLQGWDSFVNYIREGKPSDAEYVFGDALAWLDEHQNEQFFLYIQTIDPHVVYRVDRSYSKRYYEGDYKGWLPSAITAAHQVDISKGKKPGTPDDIAWLSAQYYGEISYHDEHFGLFIEELRKRGLLDNSLVVVTNDHGEELYEHGRLGHGHSLYEELLRAPLVMRFPAVLGPPRVVTEIVENVDVTPTILDVLGLSPLADADGASLLPLVRREPVQRPFYAVSEFLEAKRSIRVANYKMERGAGTYIKMYDLAADPGETADVSDKLPIARRLLEVHMGEALASPDKRKRLDRPSAKRRFQAGEAKIDPALRRQLEALGYFGG